MPYLSIFGREFFKKLLSHLKSAPSNWSNCKISWNDENAYIWDKKSLIWVFLDKILFEKLWVIFEISTFEQKCLNMAPKIPYLGSFDQKCLIWVFLGKSFKKTIVKTKMPKFGAKNAWFGYFWAGIRKQYCHIWNQHSWICLIAKFCRKTKMPKFGTKNALFGYFWARILKNYCHIWNQHPQMCQKWVFNSNSEFWYRVRFFWRSGTGSGSAL